MKNKDYAKLWEAKRCIMGDVQVAYTGNLPAPLYRRRIGKLAFPLLSRLARRERICLQGRRKALREFPWRPYCRYSVPRHSKQIKIKIKTVLQIKSRNWEMKGGKYAKTIAKIQVRGIFRIRDIRRNVLPKFIEICMEPPCWCSSRWAPTWRTETNRNICYQVLLQKREFILRRTHKH